MASASMACLRTSVDSSCTAGILPSRFDVKIAPMSALLGLGRPVAIAHASHTSLLVQRGA